MLFIRQTLFQIGLLSKISLPIFIISSGAAFMNLRTGSMFSLLPNNVSGTGRCVLVPYCFFITQHPLKEILQLSRIFTQYLSCTPHENIQSHK